MFAARAVVNGGLAQSQRLSRSNGRRSFATINVISNSECLTKFPKNSRDRKFTLMSNNTGVSAYSTEPSNG